MNEQDLKGSQTSQVEESKESQQNENEEAQGGEEEEELIYDQEQFQQDLKIVNQLELFCGLPMVTDAVSHFNDNYSQHFKFLPQEGEQSLAQYDAFTKYSEVIQPLLNKFLEDEGLETQQVFECLQRLRLFNSNCLMCLDVIMAASDYQEFCIMMNEYYNMMHWTGDTDPSAEEIEHAKAKKIEALSPQKN